jgi:hypothetical protein
MSDKVIVRATINGEPAEFFANLARACWRFCETN